MIFFYMDYSINKIVYVPSALYFLVLQKQFDINIITLGILVKYIKRMIERT